MRPRWHKIFSDLVVHPVRSLLVTASITVGLFAIGMVITIYVILSEDIRSGYQAVNPANIQVTASHFGDDFVQHIRNNPDISEAEGAWNIGLQIRTTSGEWKPISIKAQEFKEGSYKAINKPKLIEGIFPPKDKQLILDINKIDDTGAKLGDVVEIKLPSGKIRRMVIVGVVKDQTIGSSGGEGGFFLAGIQGYVTTGTLSWLEQPEGFNTLYATIRQGQEDRNAIRGVADWIINEFDNNGYSVSGSVVRLSSQHPNVSYVDAIAAVIYFLGFLVVFLSGFLITNTLSALLNQQVQQIGVMKTIGASRQQIIFMYMVMILVFSAVAFGIAVPLSNKAAYAMLQFLADKINFQMSGFRQIPASLIFQGVIALVVPQLAGSAPILQGTRISVREALTGTTAAPGESKGLINRMLTKVRGLSRPVLISLRNTFRRRGRLALTLATLMLGGATFIATLNVRNSIQSYIYRLGHYFLADVNLTLSRPYRLERVKHDILQVPGVSIVEGWAGALGNVVTESGEAGEAVRLIAPPAGSKLTEPILLKGRWIEPGDQNAIALSELFLDHFPNLQVGDTIRLQIGLQKSDWVVVGFFQFAGRASGMYAYTNYDYLSKQIGLYGSAASFRIVANGGPLPLDEQEALANRIDDHLRALDYQITDASTGLTIQENTSEGLNILTIFLLIMSFLLASVGSIGLAGTMSLNVMERTQEIGIMRAIGGSNRAIISIVIVEGIIIGFISWLLSCLAAIPLSKQLADVMFQIIFDRNADLALTISGNLIWLGLVLLLSILASSLPAISASRLTIREVLAYE